MPRPSSCSACVWVATFGYGLMLSVLKGNIAAGVYESVQYLVPMLAGLWLAGSDLDDAQCRCAV